LTSSLGLTSSVAIVSLSSAITSARASVIYSAFECRVSSSLNFSGAFAFGIVPSAAV
jgi:hypothetical protein